MERYARVHVDHSLASVFKRVCVHGMRVFILYNHTNIVRVCACVCACVRVLCVCVVCVYVCVCVCVCTVEHTLGITRRIPSETKARLFMPANLRVIAIELQMHAVSFQKPQLRQAWHVADGSLHNQRKSHCMTAHRSKTQPWPA